MCHGDHYIAARNAFGFDLCCHFVEYLIPDLTSGLLCGYPQFISNAAAVSLKALTFEPEPVAYPDDIILFFIGFRSQLVVDMDRYQSQIE